MGRDCPLAAAQVSTANGRPRVGQVQLELGVEAEAPHASAFRTPAAVIGLAEDQQLARLAQVARTPGHGIGPAGGVCGIERGHSLATRTFLKGEGGSPAHGPV